MILSSGARRAVLGAVALAAVPWTILFSALLRWVLPVPVAFALAAVLAVAWVALLPLPVVGRFVLDRLRGRRASDSARLDGIAEGLAIALGIPTTLVSVIDSALPNVLVLPIGPSAHHVVATTGAVDAMSRRELEALVASQVVDAGNGFVRVATRAQLAMGASVIVGIASPVVAWHPAWMLLAFVTVFGIVLGSLLRRPDAVRDLVADSVAVHTTKDPEALISALRALMSAAPRAATERLGVPGFLADAFTVLSTRSRVQTTVKVNGKSRSWSTADEIATEMGFRADRMERAHLGDRSVLDSTKGFRAAWKLLGSPENPYSRRGAAARRPTA